MECEAYFIFMANMRSLWREGGCVVGGYGLVVVEMKYMLRCGLGGIGEGGLASAVATV